MSRASICIHGHFYQPMRNDPKTKVIPTETAALPYQNWNERIHNECYKANAELGNFEYLSFDAGPTLMRWMQTYDPTTHGLIVKQERKNFDHYGVGNAMALPYHHAILPLATEQDRQTQIIWGIKDFIYRFEHQPAGMWLPECAVDTPTLECLAANGIGFTILAPWQVLDPVTIIEQSGEVILPSGRTITVFLYDGELSSRVSFDSKTTENAERFLIETGAGRQASEQPSLRFIASDGELYGHHQPFRDLFLKHLFVSTNRLIGRKVTYPAKWLLENPPKKAVKLNEQTSWSCHHGIARWSTGCGCTWNSEWKRLFREAADTMGSLLDGWYEKSMQQMGLNGWELLAELVDFKNGTKLLGEAFGSRSFNQAGLDTIQQLLESQWNKHRMFTSCAWFFEDFDRTEPVNAVKALAYSVWLLREATSIDLKETALQLLAPVRSWRSDLRAAQVFSTYWDQVLS